MATFDLKAYKKKMARLVREIEKGGVKSSRDAANLMEATAKQRAPRRTGETIAGIKAHHKQKYSEVISKVSPKPSTSGPFYQNLWADQHPTHLAKRMFWTKPKPFQKVVYGQGHQVTGEPGFFQKSIFLVRQDFLRTTRKNLLKALGAKFG